MKKHMKDHCYRGFTFIEMLIVMLILGIVSMIAFPVFNSTLSDSRLSGAAEAVVTALQYAQLKAVTSGRKTRAAIDAANNRIHIKQYQTIADLFNGGDQLPESDVESGTYETMPYPSKKGVGYIIDLDDENRFNGVDIAASDFNEADPVYFNEQGIPSKGGTATLIFGTRQIFVNLDSLTGHITTSS